MPNHRNATNPQLLTSKNLLLQGWSVLTCQCDSVSGFLQSRQLLFKQNWSRGNCPPTSSSQLKFFGSETDLQKPTDPYIREWVPAGTFWTFGVTIITEYPIYIPVSPIYISESPICIPEFRICIPESLIIFQNP